MAMDSKTLDGKSAVDEEGAQIEIQTTVLDWDGPSDPDNPINWPKWKRYWHIVPPAIISFAA